MNDSATYSVVLSGELKTGFELDRVIESFARLFKLPPEKAGSIIGKRYVIKREIDLQLAKTYQDKLAAIGVDVKLKRHGAGLELALEPVVSADGEQEQPLSQDEMVCPKCDLRQAKAEECSGCGVIIHKVMARTVEPGASTETKQEEQPEETVSETQSDTVASVKWMIAPVVAAIFGALLWYGIAIGMGYEFGAIAWLIGGAVGFAAVTSGARGHAIGVICGVLVLVSICSGKYMVVSSEKSEFAELMSSALEFEGVDMRAVYEEELADAQAFMQLPEGDEHLRRFMVEREYSDYYEVSEVTEEELSIFREYSQPRLEDIALNRPNFEEWQQGSLDAIEDLSTFDIMVESLDWKDMLFLFFGIGTAFQLASRGRSSSA